MSVRTRRYGELTQEIVTWILKHDIGAVFYYGTAAEDLDALLPSVSQAMNALSRQDNPLIAKRQSGWYVRIRDLGTQPEPEPEREPERERAPGPLRKGDKLEVLGVFKDGSLMLATEDGSSLWQAVQQ